MLIGGKININKGEPPAILIAPSDWGFGHVTRCIPIIKKLLQENINVIVAAEGKHVSLVQLEFPQITIVEIPGYRLKYSEKRWFMGIKFFLQTPKVFRAIAREKRWLEKFIDNSGIIAVISDCRYGLYNPNIYSVFITHQLRIKSPFGRIINKLLQGWNYKLIKKFNECWIPDWSGNSNLAGYLSHPRKLPSLPVKYIGALSRFETLNTIRSNNINLLIVLSGPEPQRTVFENIILNELKHYNGSAALVRGLPPDLTKKHLRKDQCIYDYLPAKELNDLLLRSEMIICRSGYTSIMDLIKLRKKAILVPTPGQTEQEYLAKHLMEQHIQFAVPQQKFNLHLALKEAAEFIYRSVQPDMLEFEKTIEEFICNLEKIEK